MVIFIYICICISISISISISTSTSTSTSTCICICICICKYVDVYIYIGEYVYVYVYVCVCLYIYAQRYIYLYVCMYVYVYIHFYLFVDAERHMICIIWYMIYALWSIILIWDGIWCDMVTHGMRCYHMICDVVWYSRWYDLVGYEWYGMVRCPMWYYNMFLFILRCDTVKTLYKNPVRRE